jgi:DMSO/TMAO reductase YedYZ molybdopterin-dependent catalytic subunit
MDGNEVTRRAVLQGGAALAGLAALGAPLEALAAPVAAGEEVIPWDDKRPDPPPPPAEVAGQQLVWEDLGGQITPTEKFFYVQHYGRQTIAAPGWRLDFDGLVDRPLTLTLDDIRSLPRREVTFTLECSGNHGAPFVTGLVGNAVWAGTPLAPLLRQAGWQPRASHVAFWGTDGGPAPVGDPPAPVYEQFARGMTLGDALEQDVLLCYEMNGAPLQPAHGFPVRLLAPGWYGVANVKWLRRIELLDTAYAGRFMAREYVTQRTMVQDGQESVRFTLVGRSRIKSAPARIVRGARGYRVEGVAWHAPIDRVEVRIDGDPWREAYLVGEPGLEGFAWQRWGYDLGAWSAGQHTVTARAIDRAGNVQPAPTDPVIANKLTFWESNGQITRTVIIPA